MKTFNEKVFEIVARIPAGFVITYGQIAKILGKPNAARFVGFAMNNPKMGHLPWHRVVFADGRLCPGWADIQYKKLKSEGITFGPDKKINVEKHAWSGASQASTRPDYMQDFPLVF